MDYELILITVLGVAIVANVTLMLAALPRLRQRGSGRAEATADALERSTRFVGAPGSGAGFAFSPAFATAAAESTPDPAPESASAHAVARASDGPANDNGEEPSSTNGHVTFMDLIRDPVTGLDSQLLWDQRLQDEYARTVRYGRPATVVVFELDGLERLIERFGPGAADRLVPAVAKTLRREARRSDHVARLGLGRFGVLLPEADEITAINYIERVRTVCEMWLEAGAVAVRLAIGWAGLSGDLGLDVTLHRANERLDQDRHRLSRAASVVADLVEDPAGPAAEGQSTG